MKSFLGKCAIFALCVSCILGALFFTEYYVDADRFFERNNYYGSNCPIDRLNVYEKDPNPIVILGDSRVSLLQAYESTFNDYAGEKIANLGIAGGGMQDEINLFRWCDSLTDLKTVYFEVSFYSMQKNMSADQTSDLFPLVNHPLKYLMNRGTLSRTVRFLKTGKKNMIEEATGASEPKDLSERLDTIATHIQNVYQTCAKGAGYAINDAYVRDLIDIADYCKEKGIRLVFFSTPFYKDLYDEVCLPLDIESKIAEYKSILSEKAEFLDMEFLSDFSDDPLNFNDGFHISHKGMDAYMRAILLEEGSLVKRIDHE